MSDRRRRDGDPVRVLNDPPRVVYWTGGKPGVGRRRFERHQTVAEAEQRAGELRQLLRLRVGAAPRADSTIADLAVAWVDHLRATQTAALTVQQYRSQLNTWIIPVIGDVVCRETELSDWSDVVTAVAEAGRGRSTIAGVDRTLQAMTRWGVLRGYWPPGRDPWGPREHRQDAMRRLLATANGGGLRDRIRPDDCPSWTDVEKLANEMDALYPGRGARMVKVLAGTGLRIGELVGLRVEHVDLTAGTLDVVQQADRARPWPATTNPKSGRTRRGVPVWSHVDDDLRGLVTDAVDGWLIPPDRSQRWWLTVINKRLDQACVASGWSQVGWTGHWLRHHYASWSITPQDAGGYGHPIADVSRWLGHSQVSTTMDIYVQPADGSVARARQATARPPGR